MKVRDLQRLYKDMLWSYMTSPLNHHDFHREVGTIAVLLARVLIVTAFSSESEVEGGSFLCLFDSSGTNPPGNAVKLLQKLCV